MYTNHFSSLCQQYFKFNIYNLISMSKSRKSERHLLGPLLVPDYQESEWNESESGSDVDEGKTRTRTSCLKQHMNCGCQNRYIKIKKKSSKKVIVSKNSCWEMDELTLRRQKLEIQLSNYQMEEALNMDQHAILKMRFERVENIMEAVLHYLECLQLETKSSHRLSQLLNSFIVNEHSVAITEPLSELVKKLCEDNTAGEDYCCRHTLLAAMEQANDLDDLLLNFNNKKKDFHIATQNFKILLNSANLNLLQLEKLQHQYDAILVSFQHSRRMLDQELPAVISTRMQILLDSFNELGTNLEKIASRRVDLSSLLKELESSLRSGKDLAAIKGNLHEVPLGGAIMCSNCSRSPAIAGD